MGRRSLVIVGLAALALPLALPAAELPDPVQRLQRRIDRGKVQFDFSGPQGYLLSLLDALDVPVSSQTLVFSKTSAQFRLINPRNPRAIFFNDDVYVGWVRGGPFLEISTATPEGGAAFYTLPQTPGERPRFRPDNGQCLQCHHTARTDGVPGHLVRSVYPEASGQPLFRAGTVDVRDATPFDQRWGGWYVSGSAGTMSHRGNAVLDDPDDWTHFESGGAAGSRKLSERFDVDAYPSPHSDLVALMVLTHQVRMHNAITRAAVETKRAVAYRDEMTSRFGEASPELLASVKRRIEGPSEKLVHELLFLDEAPLEGPVRGASAFADEFQARGPRDSQGRSLRDLDLDTRLLRHRCSWLIYSEPFSRLPPEVKNYVFNALDQRLADESWRATREILAATLKR